jgi:hypothetical protein
LFQEGGGRNQVENGSADKEVPGMIHLTSTDETDLEASSMTIEDAIEHKVDANIFASLKYHMQVHVLNSFQDYKGLYGNEATMDGTFVQEFVKK